VITLIFIRMVHEDEFSASMLLLPPPDTVSFGLVVFRGSVQWHVAHRACLAKKRAHPYAHLRPRARTKHKPSPGLRPRGVEIAQDRSGAATAPRHRAFSGVAAGLNLHFPRLAHRYFYLRRGSSVATHCAPACGDPACDLVNSSCCAFSQSKRVSKGLISCHLEIGAFGASISANFAHSFSSPVPKSL
jgi:hypothetical protein